MKIQSVAPDRANNMKFDLDEICAVFFRCNECRTAVSFPRIRWARLPERCPNCGASWMQEPSGVLVFSEDAVIRAFQAATAFREALQTLVTVSRSAGFTVGMEAQEESSGAEKRTTEEVSTETQRMLHAGKQAASG